MALNAVCNERLQSREQLLAKLVTTVVFLEDISPFRQSVFVFWSGLNQLHSRVKSILRHGAKIRHHLIYAQPSFAVFDAWVESKLLDYTLAEEIVKNREDICEFYYEWAFLNDQVLFQAFVDCLRVLGTRDVEVLCEIEIISSKLILNMDSSIKDSIAEQTCHTADEDDCQEPSGVVNELPIFTISESESVTTETDIQNVLPRSLSIPPFSFTWTSPVSSPPQLSHMSGIQFETNHDVPVCTGSSPEDERSLTPSNVVFASSLSSSKSTFLVATNENYRTRNTSISEESLTPDSKQKAHKSFLESGGIIQPPALGHFPLPQKGQSLTSFLSSLSNTMPELDRENAHFNVSEALISAFERLKVTNAYVRQDQVGEPDEMEDMFGTVKHTNVPANDVAEPESTRKFYSGRRFPRPPILHTETEESELEYWKQQPRRPPIHRRKKPRPGKLGSDGRSGSVLSTTDVSTTTSSPSSTEDDIASSSFSAENVALNLLRNAKMKDEHLPPACELQWLVTENDAPQTLLPLPKNWATSASESESDYSIKTDSVGKLDKSMRLRGTCDWAPPRPQIIFTVHPSPSLSILIETQRYRCAGCGMRVDPKYASTFRYCFYLGRYFCTGCHTGKKARLPQLILHKWDFSPYLVSNFSATLLESLQSDPVYNALAINPNLTKKVKLNNFRNYRIQLGFLHEYLKNCKSAERMYHEYNKFPTYYTADVDLYSLEDLLSVRFSTGLPVVIKEFVSEAVHHVLHCELCRNLGFVCEICNRNEILFPFQINRVSRCPKCSSCFHLKCFNSSLSDCPKCLRITKRRNTLEVPTASIAV